MSHMLAPINRPLPWLCDRKIVFQERQPFQTDGNLPIVSSESTGNRSCPSLSKNDREYPQKKGPADSPALFYFSSHRVLQTASYATALNPTSGSTCFSCSTGLLSGRAFSKGSATASTSSMRLA